MTKAPVLLLHCFADNPQQSAGADRFHATPKALLHIETTGALNVLPVCQNPEALSHQQVSPAYVPCALLTLWAALAPVLHLT
jgi:hypothetical protein